MDKDLFYGYSQKLHGNVTSMAARRSTFVALHANRIKCVWARMTRFVFIHRDSDSTSCVILYTLIFLSFSGIVCGCLCVTDAL